MIAKVESHRDCIKAKRAPDRGVDTGGSTSPAPSVAVERSPAYRCPGNAETGGATAEPHSHYCRRSDVLDKYGQ